MTETGTNASVATSATTIVDNEGYTAIRVNLPPIGFNKARIKIKIQDIEGEIDLIDLEVPAVIVIDPGHGGITDLDGSDANHATSPTGILEKAMTLTLGTKLRESLVAKMDNQNYKARVLLTRTEDNNVTAINRANLAGLNGADVFLSLHFNGGPPTVTSIGPEMWIYPQGPPLAGYPSAYQANHQINYQADHDFARRILDTTVSVLGQPERVGGVKGYLYRDDDDGNPVYASTPANVYQDINTYLKNVAVPGIESQYLPLSRAALLEGGYISDPIIDTWFNGAEGEMNNKNLADGLAEAIIEDIKIQP